MRRNASRVSCDVCTVVIFDAQHVFNKYFIISSRRELSRRVQRERRIRRIKFNSKRCRGPGGTCVEWLGKSVRVQKKVSCLIFRRMQSGVEEKNSSKISHFSCLGKVILGSRVCSTTPSQVFSEAEPFILHF